MKWLAHKLLDGLFYVCWFVGYEIGGRIATFPLWLLWRK